MRPRFELDDEDKEKPEKPEPYVFTAVPQALYKARTIMLFGDIDMKVAERVTAQMLALDSESADPIKIIINSPGGHVESGDTIHDVIRFLRSPVKMIGTGWVASSGAHIFIGAKKENRFCLPNTRFMLHQPFGGVRGQASDISIEAEEILKMRERINRTIARETGQPLAKVAEDTDRNYWMSAEEAKAYGLVSQIVERVDQVR